MNLPLSPVPIKKDESVVEYTEILNIGTCLLPFGYTVKATTDKVNENSTLDSVVFYVDEFTRKEYSDFKNTLLINSEYKFSKETDGYKINAEYDCIDFIGKKSIILQEN